MIAYDHVSIGNRIATQDNAATANPIFVVEQMRRVFGVLDDYTETFVWKDDEGNIGTDEEAEELPDQWERIGVVETWEFVTACFTREGAEDYIARNRHNLGQTRVFVYSGNGNQEWIVTRDMLILADAGAQALPF